MQQKASSFWAGFATEMALPLDPAGGTAPRPPTSSPNAGYFPQNLGCLDKTLVKGTEPIIK